MSDKQSHAFLYGRMKKLSSKHRALTGSSLQEDHQSESADYYLKQLKRQKILVKDRMQITLNELKRNQANLC